MKHRVSNVLTGAVVALALTSHPVLADEAARAWLTRMGEALATRNYAGEFTHASAGRSERMRIVHRVVDGRINERLVALNGTGRELVRDGDEVTCYLPDEKLAVIERRQQQGPLLGTLPQFGPDVEQWYDVSLVGRDTSVLGGNAQIVAVKPRDGYRFGFRLWIDERTGMPVRTELCDAEGRTIERVEFSSLELKPSLPDAEFRPAADPSGFRWVRQAPQPGTASVTWRAGRVPPGFRLAATSLQAMPGAPQPVQHLVFTDGLASVSVFITSPTPGKRPLEGAGKVGSSSAFSTVVNGHQVTAVGEVPPSTVKFIAGGVQPADRP